MLTQPNNDNDWLGGVPYPEVWEEALRRVAERDAAEAERKKKEQEAAFERKKKEEAAKKEAEQQELRIESAIGYGETLQRGQVKKRRGRRKRNGKGINSNLGESMPIVYISRRCLKRLVSYWRRNG